MHTGSYRDAAELRAGPVLATTALLAASACSFPATNMVSDASARVEAPLAARGPSGRQAGPVLPDPARLLACAGRRSFLGSESRAALRAVWVPSPSEDVPAVERGFGEGVSFAYRPDAPGKPDGDLYYEWGLERSTHEERTSGSAAEYWRATAGFRWALPWGEAGGAFGRLPEVFISAGAGYHDLAVSGGEEISGFGLYGGAGMEFLLGRSFSGVLDLKVHYFWGDELPEGGTANGLSVTLAAGLGLRM